MDSRYFRDLFYKALQLHRNKFFVEDTAIEQAIIALQNEYSPKHWKSNPICPPVNYNDPAFRCAYLHKYAACHAALVHEVLFRLSLNTSMLWDSFLGPESINICCLGGGPGTDIIGLLSVFCLFNEFRNTIFNFTVVDCMEEWDHALMSVMEAVRSTQFQFLNSLSSFCIYLQADMLSSIPESVRHALSLADMVTMVKFVSAAASEVTPNMLKTVFHLLKPGALVFFIDNAGGGYYDMVLEQAFACGLFMQCEPFQHVRFQDNTFRRKLFGFFSLSSTTITAQMWRKDLPVIWIPYEHTLFQRRYQTRLYSKRHRIRPFNSKYEHGSYRHTAVSKNASVSTINFNDEHCQEIRDQIEESSLDVKELCSTTKDPLTKEELSWTCNNSDPIALSLESSTSKRKLSAKKGTSAEEPKISMHKINVIKRDLLFSSNGEPSTCKHRPSTTENNFKGRKHTDVPTSPSPDILSIQSSCFRTQKDSSDATSLQDEESHTCFSDSSCLNTLREFQSSEEKLKGSEQESDLEKSSTVSLSEDVYLEATSPTEEKP